MVTPEGRIKKKIKTLLDEYETKIYYYMPVPSGYGAATVDYLGCANGVFFGIEAKAPGGHPTPRQRAVLVQIEMAGGRGFVIDSEAGVLMLRTWLDEVMKL